MGLYRSQHEGLCSMQSIINEIISTATWMWPVQLTYVTSVSAVIQNRLPEIIKGAARTACMLNCVRVCLSLRSFSPKWLRDKRKPGLFQWPWSRFDAKLYRQEMSGWRRVHNLLAPDWISFGRRCRPVESCRLSMIIDRVERCNSSEFVIRHRQKYKAM